MVAVFGDVKEKDDYTHPLGPEENFNESMYFNFFDHKRGQGGFARIERQRGRPTNSKALPVSSVRIHARRR